MPTQDVRVTNLPSSDSHYRVAWEMATTIAKIEGTSKENAREYFLELFHQCHRVVYNGDTAKKAMASNGTSSGFYAG